MKRNSGRESQFITEFNPKRVGCFNRKENSGLRVLQGQVENLRFPVWKSYLRENQTVMQTKLYWRKESYKNVFWK